MSNNDQEPTDVNGPGLGVRLQGAREALGLEREAAAESFGIPVRVIEALESEEYYRLEAPVYVRGYLRKYAHFLGLPEAELLEIYTRSAGFEEPVVRAHATTQGMYNISSRWLFPAGVGIFAVLLILAGLWAWHRSQQNKRFSNIPPTAVSAAMASSVNVPLSATMVRSGGSVTASQYRISSRGAVQTGISLRLRLHVTSPSWIEVYGPDHQRLYYNLAAAGQNIHLDSAHGPLTVFLGNAPGVEIKVNGRPYTISPRFRKGKTARFQISGSVLPSPAVTR